MTLGSSSKKITCLTFLVSSRCHPDQKRDVDVIIELPREGGQGEALKHVKLFTKSLAYRSTNQNACWRPRVRVADSTVHNINTFDCHTLACVTRGLNQLKAGTAVTHPNV